MNNSTIDYRPRLKIPYEEFKVKVLDLISRAVLPKAETIEEYNATKMFVEDWKDEVSKVLSESFHSKRNKIEEEFYSHQPPDGLHLVRDPNSQLKQAI